jgi:hypothetical protein
MPLRNPTLLLMLSVRAVLVDLWLMAVPVQVFCSGASCCKRRVQRLRALALPQQSARCDLRG